jgi:hypothetical protein
LSIPQKTGQIPKWLCGADDTLLTLIFTAELALPLRLVVYLIAIDIYSVLGGCCLYNTRKGMVIENEMLKDKFYSTDSEEILSLFVIKLQL